MKKIVFSLFLVGCFMGVSIFPVQGVVNTSATLQTVFVEEVVQQKQKDNALVPIVVELSVPCVIEQSDRNASIRSFYDSKQDFVLDYTFEPTVLSQQKSFLSFLTKKGISFRDTEMNCTLVANSVALEVKGTDIEQLKDYPGVTKIWSNEIKYYPTRYVAAQTTHAIEAWKGIATNSSAMGSGVRVGILDSGLDSTHDDFQKRVKGGFDYGDNDPDYNDKSGHGTHVAGIIGGKSDDNKFSVGMAPDCLFYIYKVFSSSSPGANTQNIIKGVEQSIKDKCDVINLSLGHESGDPATTTGYYSDGFRNASKTGMMVVVAAGNEGSRGNKQKYAIGSPSSVDACFSVAATDDRSGLSFSATANGEKRRIVSKLAQYSPSFSNQLSNVALVDCGYGKPETIPEEVQGKIAILQRGPKNSQMTFREKMDNVRNAGAVALIIYNYQGEQAIPPGIAVQGEDPSNIDFIPTCMISYYDGQWLLEHSDAVSLDFSQGTSSVMATFSSQGPGADGWFKPEISTPGTNIMSTVPRNSYGLASGTSMASPVMAGLVALLKNLQPEWSPAQIKSAFMNTADILLNEVNGLPVTFTLQGAGQALIDRAAETSAFISPQALVVKKNEILPFQTDSTKPVQITIENTKQKTMHYDIRHEVFLLPGENNPVDIIIDTEKLSLGKKEKGSISVTFDCDYKSMSKPRYEGVIYIADLHIPFIVYRDGPNYDVEALSDIRVTPEDLMFTQENATEDISVQFSLNSGEEQIWDGFSGGSSYSNYGNIKIAVIDEYGEEWGTIATLAGLLIGDYQIHWNGKDSSGRYLLPKGKYHIEIRVTNWRINGGEYQYYQDAYSSQHAMNVVESIVPEPGNLIVAVQKLLSPRKYFTVDLILEDAEDVVGLEYEFSYNGNKLMCEGAFDGGFFSSDGADVELVEDIDDSEDGHGIVSLYRYAQRDQEEGISGQHVKISSLSFKPLDSGRMSINLLNCQLIYTNGSKAKLRYRGGSFTVSKEYDFLLCDLNNDKVVDMYDWRIFKEHYLTVKTDKNYNKECDFNQDERIDIEDLVIFGREYRKML